MDSPRKPEILRHSAHLFRTNGYIDASMRKIAAAVGIDSASLYSHLKSKGEILQTICHWAAGKYLSNIESVEHSDQTPLKKLEAIIRMHIRMMIEEYDRAFVAEHEWNHLPEPHLSNFLNQRRIYRRKLADLVQDGILKGEIKKIDPYVAVITFLSAIQGIEFWQRSQKNTSAEELEENMVRYLVGGLKM